MIQEQFNYRLTNEKTIEKIINDEQVHLNHMVLPKGDSLPEHYSNSNVYMIIIRGRMTLQLDETIHILQEGKIVTIPYRTKMNVQNLDEDVLEFFVIKSPNPKNYKE